MNTEQIIESSVESFIDLADAHKQGFDAGLYNTGSPFINPVNDYQKDYNRGYAAGSYMRVV